MGTATATLGLAPTILELSVQAEEAPGLPAGALPTQVDRLILHGEPTPRMVAVAAVGVVPMVMVIGKTAVM
jgi:hypothetical protein